MNTRSQLLNEINLDKENSAIDVGRQSLSDWEVAQPTNFFTADLNLQRTLEYHWGVERYRQHAAALYEFGKVAALNVDPAARIANKDENLPRLDRFGAWGDRREDVIFHPAHHEAGRYIYASGMMSAYANPGSNLYSLALFYLSSQNGEAGHNCPIACTAGLIKVLQELGTEELQDRYLPPLLNPDYDENYHGAQFLTEVQGGSDVGANATVAMPAAEPGQWMLNGEKWFCSNITADLGLVTARVPGQGSGTSGLGLFLLPRVLDDGRPNGVYIRRLKEKLGTRSMATGELELRDAVAYQVGPTESGFKNVMTHVINTSRIYNAVGVCGNARRAYVIASTYAQHRRAFNRAIVHFPIVQDILANMRSDLTAMLSGTMQIIRTMDLLEEGSSISHAAGFLRMAININKYRSAIMAHRTIVSAIELLGGNGAIEDFSILPRLLRDNIVYENWEGTHNVLLDQVQRDMRKYQIQHPFFAVLSDMVADLVEEGVRQELNSKLNSLRAELDEVLSMDELTAGIYFRPLMDHVTDLYYAVCLAREADWELGEKQDRTKQRIARLFINRRLGGREPKDIPYYDDLVSRLCT